MREEKTGTYPYRPPKKFPQKNLHGRPRLWVITYKDLKRFQNFYINVFGWDMIEMPEATSGIAPGNEHPSLLIGTGPCQPDYEGSVPGHMNMFVHWAPGELEPQGPQLEIHMDVPLKDMIQNIIDHGGSLVLDKRISVLAKTPVDKESWEVHAVVKDPAGNYLYLWKCPTSRTWEEPETGYDKE